MPLKTSIKIFPNINLVRSLNRFGHINFFSSNRLAMYSENSNAWLVFERCDPNVKVRLSPCEKLALKITYGFLFNRWYAIWKTFSFFLSVVDQWGRNKFNCLPSNFYRRLRQNKETNTKTTPEFKNKKIFIWSVFKFPHICFHQLNICFVLEIFIFQNLLVNIE